MKKINFYDYLIDQILAKKQLKNIDKDVVIFELEQYLKRNSKIRKKFSDLHNNSLENIKKNAVFKTIVKGVRNELNKIYGTFVFKESLADRDKYLTELKTLMKKSKFDRKIFYDIHRKLLFCHKSSKERIDFYLEIYKRILAITGKVRSIMDLSCGLNPCSYLFFLEQNKINNLKCYVSELNEKDCEFLRKYFAAVADYLHISYKIERKNLLKIEQKNIFEDFEKYDLCFLWKTVDVLERGKGHKITELLVENIPAKWIVISFSTITLRKKLMRHPYRGWIERMLLRKNLPYTKFHLDDELFYVIKKS